MKIGITGTQSVGKTTLVKALSKLPEFKDYNCITERSQHLMGLGIPLNTDSTLKGQTVFLAERANELMFDNLITDRTVIDVMAFTKSAKSIGVAEALSFTDLAQCFIKEYDYIFYISPENVEMEDNNIRETNPQYRNTIDEEIRYILQYFSHLVKNVCIISGTTEERVQKIKETISL